MGKVNRKDQTFYIYRHVRLDTNEVFYIGKGKSKMHGKSERNFFYRAFQKTSRSLMWYSITNKTEYIIEIIFMTKEEKDINKKEIEFIELYGRRDLHQGTLVNFTKGGDGVTNLIRKKESIQKQKEKLILFYKDNPHHQAEKVYAYCQKTGQFRKEFKSQNEAARYLGVCATRIGDALKSVSKRCSNMILRKDYEGESIDISNIPQWTKEILCFDSEGRFIKEFSSNSEAAKFFNAKTSKISSSCIKGWKHKGHYFKFKRQV